VAELHSDSSEIKRLSKVAKTITLTLTFTPF
jgi:hypothetical protein